MDKRVAIGFYVIIGVVGIALAWLLDARQTTVEPETTSVKQNTLQLKPEDFSGESQDVQNAINNLMRPVQKPGGDNTSSQLQPAAGSSGAQQSPQ